MAYMECLGFIVMRNHPVVLTPADGGGLWIENNSNLTH